MIALAAFAVVAVILTIIDMKELKKNNPVKNIVIYISLMVIAIGLYGVYRFSDSVSIFGYMLRLWQSL